MTARGTWKAFERRVARLLGGTRIPITGRARGDQPDIAHPLYSLEVKLRDQPPPAIIRDALDQAKAAVRPGQIPVVVLGRKRHDVRQALVVLELGDFSDHFGGPTR